MTRVPFFNRFFFDETHWHAALHLHERKARRAAQRVSFLHSKIERRGHRGS
jgi:hypothetical protein